MIETCPVCGGALYADEERFGRRSLQTRRVVRCDSCRSVLRQRGNTRWYYAVDPEANPEFHRRHNGRTFMLDELFALLDSPPTGTQSPTIIEGKILPPRDEGESS